jgi:hypothetical protein
MVQVDNWVTDQLPGAVQGDIATAVAGNTLNPRRLQSPLVPEEIVSVCISSECDDRRVLKEDQQVVGPVKAPFN